MLENTLSENVKNLPFFSNKKFQQPIAQIFLKFTEQQKSLYLLEMISFIKNQYQNSQEDSSLNYNNKQISQKSISTIEQVINMIQTTAQMQQQTIMKLSYWAQIRFKFNKIQRFVQVTNIKNKKKSFKLNLRLYLIRKSHSIDHCIVFHSLKDDVINELRAIHFTFQKQIFLPIWNELHKVIIKSRKQELLQLMIQDSTDKMMSKDSIQGKNQNNNNKNKQIHQIKDKTLVFLSTKSINKYLKYKQSILKRLQVGKFDFQQQLSENLYQHPFIKSFKIERSLRANNLFKIQVILKKSSYQIKKQFISCFKQKFKYVLMQSILEINDKYQAIYQRFLLRGNRVNQVISIRQCPQITQKGLQKQDILFVKGIQHIINKEYVQFLMAKVKNINQIQSKLIVIGSFLVDQYFSVDVIIKYLLQFKDMLYRSESKNNQDHQNQQQFFSICSDFSYQDIQLQEGLQKCESQDQERNNIYIQSSPEKQRQIQQNNLQSKQASIKIFPVVNRNILNTKHSTNTLQKTDTLLKQHYLFKDWTRVKHGGVACYNQVKISQQKKLFKKVITKMGSSILKGNGILNLSLPVDIFKKQSQLTSIARDFCFAPLFLQKGVKSTSSIQRIKWSTLLAISVGNLGISLQKPFNPILGQTLQCWIDNCPMYLQQISHHPPLSAYYMIGRGYKIDGQIESKISLGMNTAKGFSQRPNHIIYDDGTKMTMVYGKMLIKGMLFGDRQFTFEQKIFVYDQTNNLFSQILYGPRKKSKDPNDFISGKITKVKPSFKLKFYSNNQNHYPIAQDIQSQVSSFQGIWTQIIKFDNKQYINFKTQLPYELIDQKFPLDSNSLYRKDLLKLIQNNIPQAQKHKELMEQEQRKDRKLRQKYKIQKKD